MEYEIVWREGPLGLTLRPDRGLLDMPPVVGRITRADSAAAHAKVAVGDMLVAINGVDTTGQGYDIVVNLLQKIPRPATLRFRVPPQRAVDTSSHSFSSARSELSPQQAKEETKERRLLSVAPSAVSAENTSDSKPPALDESRLVDPQQGTTMRQHGASDIRHPPTQESDESEDESRDDPPSLAAFDALQRNLLKLAGVSESEPAILDTRPAYATQTIEIDSMPTEPIPVATTTAFHDVQPKLESLVGARETYRLVRALIAEYAFKYQCFSDWTITAGVLVVGEELEIIIAVLCVASSNTSVVDFRLLQGDDMHFLHFVSTIRTCCRAVDKRLHDLQESSRRGFFPEWPLEHGVGSRTTTEDALREMILDIMSGDLHPVLRESAAQEFKDACVDQTNRATLQTNVPDDLLRVLRIMLADNNGRIVLFGLHILLEYAKQLSVRWDGLEDEYLSEQCDLLLKSPCRPSIKWLVHRLQEAKLGGSITVNEDDQHRESQFH